MTPDARTRRLQDHLLDAPYEICIERARYVTESHRRSGGMSPPLRAAHALQHTLRHMSVTVHPAERFLGNRSSKPLGTVLPVERGDVNVVLDLELDALLARPRRPFHITPEDRAELTQDILPYWRGRTLRDRKNALWQEAGLVTWPAFGPASLLARHRSLDLGRLATTAAPPGQTPRKAWRALRELLHNNLGLVTNVFDTQGHLIVGHRNVLRGGFRAICERARSQLGQQPDLGDAAQRDFLKGVLVSGEALRDFAGRVADRAEALAAREDQRDRAAELRAMAARCRRVPWEPPRDFREAVQALWLTQVGAIVAYGMTGILAVGRLDQILYPYYAADVEAGVLDDAEARVWLEELLLKLGTNLLLLPHVGKQTGNELGADSCAPTIGGVDREGRDAVNPLSYLVLDAFENVRSTGNSFAIRLSAENPRRFWQRSLATFRTTSGAALHNDEVVIPALQGCGYRVEDARDYGIVGCVEPTGEGDTFGCTSGNDVSLPAALEMTLLDGHLRILGRRFGPRTGDPREFSDFPALLQAFQTQVAFLVRTVVRATNLKDLAYRQQLPNPLVSATLRGCVERGRDMTAGGADYNFGSVSGRGLGTAVDSLAAVQHAVFETGRVSMAELLTALRTDFRKDEVLCQWLRHRPPKYGQDAPAADAIARVVVAAFCQEVASHRTTRGGPFRPGFFSYGMHVLEGLLLGASPDGRKAGEPLSNSFSPVNGVERNGPTATLRSVASVDHCAIANGCALNMKFLPDLFSGEERLDRMVGMVQGFFREGGQELSPNVVSSATLLDAQRHPDQYRDLVVRVSGYSAYFTDLGAPLQDEIISRTEFGRL